MWGQQGGHRSGCLRSNWGAEVGPGCRGAARRFDEPLLIGQHHNTPKARGLGACSEANSYEGQVESNTVVSLTAKVQACKL
eukprot:XP_001694897.1 predicted protein [Chlamydomonas reinhardtii]